MERRRGEEGDRRVRAGDDDAASPKFVPPEERIATFDQDGTLWVEHPIYTQVMYCLDRVPALVAKKPELANVEPFKTVLSGDHEAIAKLPMPDLEKILAATLTRDDGRSSSAPKRRSGSPTAKHPRWKRPYTELTYQPMLEVMKYLRANGYKTYIVTGGGQDFVRVYAEQVYGIPPEQVVGTRGRHEVRLRQARQADAHQGAEAPAERQQRRQARGHPSHDRAPAATPRSATRPAISRCSNTPGAATARGSRCWCSTTMRRASTPTARRRGCPTPRSARSPRRSTTRRRRRAGP